MTTTRYELRDVHGVHVATHVRRDLGDGSPKKMHWELPDGTPKLNGLKVSQLPLYGSEKLAQHTSIAGFVPGDIHVVVCEGEKSAGALWKLGIVAVATVCGGGVTPDPKVFVPLLPFNIVLWPDHDAAGQRHSGEDRPPPQRPRRDGVDDLVARGTPEG
jgi:hypothetical protein